MKEGSCQCRTSSSELSGNQEEDHSPWVWTLHLCPRCCCHFRAHKLTEMRKANFPLPDSLQFPSTTSHDSHTQKISFPCTLLSNNSMPGNLSQNKTLQKKNYTQVHPLVFIILKGWGDSKIYYLWRNKGCLYKLQNSRVNYSVSSADYI